MSFSKSSLHAPNPIDWGNEGGWGVNPYDEDDDSGGIGMKVPVPRK